MFFCASLHWHPIFGDTLMFPLIIALSGLFFSNDVANVSEELNQLVEAHSSAVALIHSIDLRLEQSADANPRQLYRFRWSRRSNQERIRYDFSSARGDTEGTVGTFGDLLIDSGECKYLENWNPSNPPHITPASQGKIRATTFPKTRKLPFVVPEPVTTLLLRFRLDNMDREWELAELVAEYPNGCSVERGIQVDGHDVIRIRVRVSRGPANGTTGNYIDVFLDPAVNFMARKTLSHTEEVDDRPELSSLKGTDFKMEGSVTVKRFRDCGNGVFVPEEMSIEHSYLMPGSPSARVVKDHAVVKELTVNTDLPADSFDFKFPAETLVRHFPPVNGKVRVDLWGADNRPKKAITNEADLREFTSLNRLPEPNRRRMYIVMGINAVLIAVVAVVFLRKRYYPK